MPGYMLERNMKEGNKKKKIKFASDLLTLKMASQFFMRFFLCCMLYAVFFLYYAFGRSVVATHKKAHFENAQFYFRDRVVNFFPLCCQSNFLYVH